MCQTAKWRSHPKLAPPCPPCGCVNVTVHTWPNSVNDPLSSTCFSHLLKPQVSCSASRVWWCKCPVCPVVAEDMTG